MLDALLLEKPKKVLFTVLNWGLGHATRSVPIILELLNKNIDIVLASDGDAGLLLKKQFPNLNYIELTPYNVRYNKKSLLSIVLSNVINVNWAIYNEHKQLKDIIRNENIDMIISDSRFGMWHKTIKSYIVSHQLNFQSNSEFLSKVINCGNSFFINKFNACLIPDFEDHALSGILSQNEKIKRKIFLGPISRLTRADQEKTRDIVIILSGPEPARRKLEKELVRILVEKYDNVTLIRGTSQKEKKLQYNGHWKIYNLADSQQINDVLTSSRMVISRSGYTSIMDYCKLGIGAILIPTPGQTEQEYLAKYLDKKNGFKAISENDLDQLCDHLDELLIH